MENIKKNYCEFLKKHAYYCHVNSISELVYKKQYIEILKEIEDISRNSVECLTETQTEILRKYIGVYGKKYITTEIADDLNITSARIGQIIKCIGSKLRRRILRGYANLQDAVLNGEITQEKLLNMDLDVLDSRALEKLYACGCCKIGDVIEISCDKLIECTGIGKKKLEGIVDYIHSLGLEFKDENSYITKLNSNKCSDDSKESLGPKGQLGIIYKQIEKDEEKCDKIIEKQMNKKQELIEYRKEILEISSQLSEVPKVNKKGTR